MATLSLGPGWRPLCEQLAVDLQRLDPPGELLEAGIDASGLPRFTVKVAPAVKAQARRLVHEYEGRALDLCESCGGPGRLRAGAVLSSRCDHCV